MYMYIVHVHVSDGGADHCFTQFMFTVHNNYYDCFAIECLGDAGLELISTPVSHQVVKFLL